MNTETKNNRKTKNEGFSDFLKSVAEEYGHTYEAPVAPTRAERRAKSNEPRAPKAPGQQSYEALRLAAESETDPRRKAYLRHLAETKKPVWHPAQTDSQERRHKAATALIQKATSYGWQTRKALLTYVRELDKHFFGFPVEALLKLGLLKKASIDGKKGSVAKEQKAAERDALNALMNFEAPVLVRMLEEMSLANIRKRYNRDLSPAEVNRLFGKPVLSDDEERTIDAGPRSKLSGWLRSKKNAEARNQRKAAVRCIRRIKAAHDAAVRTPRVSTRRYLVEVAKRNVFLDEGRRQRRVWMDEIEARTRTKQKDSNLA